MPRYDFECLGCKKVEEKTVPVDQKFARCDCGWSMTRLPAASNFAIKGDFTAKNGYSRANG